MPAFDFVLAGRYRLVAPLGEGGMAAVYRGRDLRLNREVAVKVLRDDLTRDPEFLARFEREAQVVASLSHPHIVPVFDVGEESGSRFIVMEYVRGRTLAEAIDSSGALSPDRAVAALKPVLDALDYAHSRGLVHRDIKPQNILLTVEGVPRLADFGIAHLVDSSSTRTAAILGSAEYLSPEQSRGEEATSLSDLYACGVVLYQMLAGHPPFQGGNALAIANQHLHAAPPPLLDDVPRSLSHAVMRALAKDPTKRFPDARSFSAALGNDAVIPSRVDATAVQPLVESDEGARALPLIRQRGDEIRVEMRRSARKTYVLAAALGLATALVGYVASLNVIAHYLPAYPSAPYALLPAAVAVVMALSWVNTRSWMYTVDGDAATVQWGLVGHHRFGVPLRNVSTLHLQQSPIDRLLGVGTIQLTARDQQGVERYLTMEDLPAPRQAYDELVRLLGRAARSRAPELE